eukprot:scaffold33355_cov65-Cyclotella_meneghiniana.AAC.3
MGGEKDGSEFPTFNTKTKMVCVGIFTAISQQLDCFNKDGSDSEIPTFNTKTKMVCVGIFTAMSQQLDCFNKDSSEIPTFNTKTKMANGLNNDEDFRCDEIDDMQGRNHLEQHQSQTSMQKYSINVAGKWNGEKRLRNERDIIAHARTTRNQLAEKPSTEKGLRKWLYMSIINGMTRIAASLNYQEHEGKRTSLMEDQGRNDTPIVNQECDDPPRLMDEDEERGSITQSKKSTQCSTRIETGVRTKEGKVVKLGPPSRKYHTQITHRDGSSCNLSSAEAQDMYEENMYTYAEIVEATEARILAAYFSRG